MTPAPTPPALAIADLLEYLDDGGLQFDGQSLPDAAAAELIRLQAENERLLAQTHKLEMDALDLASENSILKRTETDELEARKPLPLSAEGPVMDWRPIETAPKDGTWIMLWRAPAKEGDGWTADPLVIARWYEDEFGDAEWTWPDDPFDPFTPHGIARANAAVESGASWGEENFTHWIPLPSPPEAS